MYEDYIQSFNIQKLYNVEIDVQKAAKKYILVYRLHCSNNVLAKEKRKRLKAGLIKCLDRECSRREQNTASY